MDANAQGLPFQNAESTVWQGQKLQKQEVEDHLTYWKRQLAGAPPALDLPIDHPRQPTQNLSKSRYSFALPQPLSAALKTLGTSEGNGLFATLLAAFQTLLHRYTGQDDLLVGTPGIERTQARFASGGNSSRRFVNTLVLRTSVSGDSSFRELLGRVHEVVLEAYAHQDAPFEQVVDALQPEREPGRHPLFQVMFVLAELEEREFGLNSTSMAIDGDAAGVDLILAVQDTTQELSGWIEYSADLFEAATIARMMGHWQRLLEGVVQNPTRQLSELPLLTKEEWQQLVVEWNDTAADYPEDRCIHQLFEAQVDRNPDAVAVVYQDAHLTYRELNRRANQLAHYLQRLGVGPEVLVGLCVERSFEMIMGLLAILKAGGAYVPLDPTYPSERLAFMLTDSQASVLVTQEFLILKNEMEAVYLDRDWDRISQESEENPISDVMAQNAAYVIYTSGSTGTPKGVVIQHASLVNYAGAADAAYALVPEDRVLQFAPISFDTSAEEIYPCLTRGATLFLRTSSMIDTPSLFLKKCQDWALTVLDLPTAYWHELTRKIAAEAITLPPSLRLVIIGGERALPEMVASWQQHVSQRVQLVNTYGPTEATIVATVYRVPGSPDAGTALREVPIGRPIPNAQVYLLDRYLKAVPIGVPGELHIGGIGLAREYLRRPGLTAEKFIPHPFSNEPAARLYKTGDLARYLPGGDIEFLGRLDQQVKIRGYRIELGEIETALGRHPDVQEAVVLAREDVSGSKRLVAYVVPRHGQTLTSSKLRRFMQESLPDYMIPAVFALLEALPLTPSGKVDRRGLPAPEQTRPELAEQFVAPTLTEHQQLIQIWEELLDVRPIGIRDNFFELGGHSLLAVRLVDRIEQVWGKKISPTTLLSGPTIEQLTNALLQPDVSASRTQAEAAQANGSRLASSVKSLLANLMGRR